MGMKRKERRASNKLSKARDLRAKDRAKAMKAAMPKTTFDSKDGRVIVHIHMPNRAGGKPAVVMPAITPGGLKRAQREADRAAKMVARAIKALTTARSTRAISKAKKRLAKAKAAQRKAQSDLDRANAGKGVAGA